MMLRMSVVAVAAVFAASCGSDDGVTTAAGEARCDPASFLTVLQRELDDEATGLHVGEADVRRCQKGYAEVGAVPDNADCEEGVGSCYDTATVFLEALGGEWTVIEVGTGVTCNDTDLSEQLRTACESLAQPG